MACCGKASCSSHRLMPHEAVTASCAPIRDRVRFCVVIHSILWPWPFGRLSLADSNGYGLRHERASGSTATWTGQKRPSLPCVACGMRGIRPPRSDVGSGLRRMPWSARPIASICQHGRRRSGDRPEKPKCRGGLPPVGSAGPPYRYWRPLLPHSALLTRQGRSRFSAPFLPRLALPAEHLSAAGRSGSPAPPAFGSAATRHCTGSRIAVSTLLSLM